MNSPKVFSSFGKGNCVPFSFLDIKNVEEKAQLARCVRILALDSN
jgi:hypothetical protein